MEAGEVPPTAPIRAGDVPMHAATSIVHGIFILLLGKVLLAQGGRHGMLVIAADRRQLHSAAFRFFVMMV
jgi:hypothetical protein